jgi:hypothetical protein
VPRKGRCPTGKQRFETHEQARQALADIAALAVQGNPRRRESRAYRCKLCKGGWHLTSSLIPQGDS